MSTLQELRAKADAASAAFDILAAQEYGADGRWIFYKRDESGLPNPPELLAAHNKAIATLHAFYEARDGARGFLGSRGL